MVSRSNIGIGVSPAVADRPEHPRKGVRLRRPCTIVRRDPVCEDDRLPGPLLGPEEADSVDRGHRLPGARVAMRNVPSEGDRWSSVCFESGHLPVPWESKPDGGRLAVIGTIIWEAA